VRRAPGSRPPPRLLAHRNDARRCARGENRFINENLVAAGVPRFAFACGCRRSGCAERVELTLAEFAVLDRLVASAHTG